MDGPPAQLVAPGCHSLLAGGSPASGYHGMITYHKSSGHRAITK